MLEDQEIPFKMQTDFGNPLNDVEDKEWKEPMNTRNYLMVDSNKESKFSYKDEMWFVSLPNSK